MLKAYLYSQYTAIKRSSSTPTPACSRRCASFEDSYPSSNTCWTCTFSIYKTARAIPTTTSSKIATKFPIEPKATAGIQMNTWRRNFLQVKLQFLPVKINILKSFCKYQFQRQHSNRILPIFNQQQQQQQQQQQFRQVS